MWFGTFDGLKRYDGYDFKVYRHDPADPTSLSHRQVDVIFEDLVGDFWVSTYGGGMNRFDRETERKNSNFLFRASLLLVGVLLFLLGPVRAAQNSEELFVRQTQTNP